MILGTLQLCEIFSSVQGEGLCLGTATLFIRFSSCDLRCRWCDTPQTWKDQPQCRVEIARGSGKFHTLPNPVSSEDVLDAFEALELDAHRFVSFTGGEPLLQAQGVRALARMLRGRGPRLLLETHGAAPEALAETALLFDVVSMDWKFSSDVSFADGDALAEPGSLRELSRASLVAARAASEVVVKAVVTPNTTTSEFRDMCENIAEVDSTTPLIIQPVTPCAKVRESAPAQRLLELLYLAERRLEDVRLIPQTHKILQVP